MENLINIDAEKTILGSIIMNNQKMRLVIDFLEPKHFYYLENQKVYERIAMTLADAVADKITLKEFFNADEDLKTAGGSKYLAELMGSASNMANIRDYAKTLIELWQKREFNRLIDEAKESLGTEKFDTVKARLENDILGLALRDAKKKTQHVSETMDEMDEEERLGIVTNVIPTGFPFLDEKLNGGLYAQQLAIIGARPSIGKTTIGQNIILNASKAGKKCLFVSLEVDKKRVVLKFLSNLSCLNSWRIENKKLQPYEFDILQDAKNQLRELKIFTNDSSNMRAIDIENVIKNQIEINPVDLVVVDYVQYMRYTDAKGKNEASSIKENTTALKSMAKKYDVAMLALAQINRKGAEGANQEPTMNDLKGSGGIEEDADVLMILHRDRLENEEKQKGYFSNSAKLIIAKNRYGMTGDVGLSFDGPTGKFQEREDF
jgi:replicative DNA helicase